MTPEIHPIPTDGPPWWERVDRVYGVERCPDGRIIAAYICNDRSESIMALDYGDNTCIYDLLAGGVNVEISIKRASATLPVTYRLVPGP